MIPSLLALTLWTGQAFASEEAGSEDGSDPASAEEGSGDADPVLDDALSPYRLPFSVLVDRSIGVSSKPTEFNWRRSTAMVAATGDHLFELNNFNSLRAGGMVRVPSAPLIYEVGLSYVWVWDTPASQLLALTPYRQPGRPQRLELDLTVGLPVAEGVVTAAPRWFPPVELVFNAYASLRYLVYPSGFKELRPREVAAAVLAPALSQAEVDNLDGIRLDAMQVDSARYGVMIGVGNDLYFKQGFFVSPRAMFAVPVFAPATQTQLLLWADFSLAVGVAF